MTRNQKIKYGIILALASASNAHAALPTEVTTAIDTAKSDGTSLGWAMLGMAVVVGVIFWLKRKA